VSQRPPEKEVAELIPRVCRRMLARFPDLQTASPKELSIRLLEKRLYIISIGRSLSRYFWKQIFLEAFLDRSLEPDFHASGFVPFLLAG
jgi:hypothetical protein